MPPEKAQPFGQACKRHLSDLLYRKPVTVEFHKKDKYGRTVGKILLGDEGVYLEQLNAGMASIYRSNQHEQSIKDRMAYAAGGHVARASGIELRSDKDPVAPRTF